MINDNVLLIYGVFWKFFVETEKRNFSFSKVFYVSLAFSIVMTYLWSKDFVEVWVAWFSKKSTWISKSFEVHAFDKIFSASSGVDKISKSRFFEISEMMDF